MNFVVSDETSSIKVTKFFLGRRFRSYSFFSSQKSLYKPGTKLAISGKVKLTDYGKTFVDPQIEILKDNNDDFNFSGKILPLYSLAEAMSNMSFIKLIFVNASANEYKGNIFPEKLKLSLLSLRISI